MVMKSPNERIQANAGANQQIGGYGGSSMPSAAPFHSMVGQFEMAEKLKGASMDYLKRYVRNPSGNIPLYMVMAELQRRVDGQRRAKMAEAAAKEKRPTVAQQVLDQAGMTQEGGIMSPVAAFEQAQANRQINARSGGLMKFNNGGLVVTDEVIKRIQSKQAAIVSEDRVMEPEAIRKLVQKASRAADQAGLKGEDKATYMALLERESAFHPEARSATGALGIGQITTDTAKDPGFNVASIKPNDRLNVDKSLKFSAEYYKGLVDKHGNNTVAAAAYNIGTGTIDAAGTDPLQNLAGGFGSKEIQTQFKEETEPLVAEVTANRGSYATDTSAAERPYDFSFLRGIKDRVTGGIDDVANFLSRDVAASGTPPPTTTTTTAPPPPDATAMAQSELEKQKARKAIFPITELSPEVTELSPEDITRINADPNVKFLPVERQAREQAAERRQLTNPQLNEILFGEPEITAQSPFPPNPNVPPQANNPFLLRNLAPDSLRVRRDDLVPTDKTRISELPPIEEPDPDAPELKIGEFPLYYKEGEILPQIKVKKPIPPELQVRVDPEKPVEEAPAVDDSTKTSETKPIFDVDNITGNLATDRARSVDPVSQKYNQLYGSDQTSTDGLGTNYLDNLTSKIQNILSGDGSKRGDQFYINAADAERKAGKDSAFTELREMLNAQNVNRKEQNKFLNSLPFFSAALKAIKSNDPSVLGTLASAGEGFLTSALQVQDKIGQADNAALQTRMLLAQAEQAQRNKDLDREQALMLAARQSDYQNKALSMQSLLGVYNIAATLEGQKATKIGTAQTAAFKAAQDRATKLEVAKEKEWLKQRDNLIRAEVTRRLKVAGYDSIQEAEKKTVDPGKRAELEQLYKDAETSVKNRFFSR